MSEPTSADPQIRHEHASRSNIRVVKQKILTKGIHAPKEDDRAIEDALSISLKTENESACESRELVMRMQTPSDDRAMIIGLLFPRVL